MSDENKNEESLRRQYPRKRKKPSSHFKTNMMFFQKENYHWLFSLPEW